MTTPRRWPWAIVAALVGLLACDPDPRPTRVYLEDFEGLCDGAPCGWERTSGESEQARWVETIHPGEHGLRLEGDVSVRGPASDSDARTVNSRNLSARLAIRCDAGSAVRLDVLLVDELGTTFSASGDAMPPSNWDRELITLLVDATMVTNARISTVMISKSGSGACDIGELVIDDAGRSDDIVC